MSKQEKFLLLVNVIIYGFLSIFSYAYVDLNLTISQNYYILYFIKLIQGLGYYNRPISTLIYLIFLITAFSFFVINLILFHKSKIGLTYLKASVIFNTLILIFAYPFLSSDLFNYLFDAKIILEYHLSPYTHRALDFPNDDWVRFMRWVHRYSPYGPLWLLMSLVPAMIGLGKFILNLIAFKIFIGLFHLINSYLIFNILKIINPQKATFGTAFYALNPLFLLEGVANSHNDIILAALLLASVFFLSFNKPILSHLSILAGILIKYVPILNFPYLIWFTLNKKNRDINKLIFLNFFTLALFTYVFSSFKVTVPFVSSGATQVQFQPWYLFWTLPYISLIPRVNLLLLAVAISLGASLRYLPFMMNGDWSQPGTNAYMTQVTIIPALAVLLFIALKSLKEKSKFFPKIINKQ